MIRRLAAFAILTGIAAIMLAPTFAFGQVVTAPAVNVDQTARSAAAVAQAKADAAATPASVASAVSAVQAAMPQPATTVGSGEQVGGAVGSATTYKRGDWIPPRISRTGSCALTASGTCTASWTSSFAAGVTPIMLGDPVAQNTAGNFPITCNVTAAPTISGVPVKCWMGQSSVVSILGAAVLAWNTTSLSGVTVTVSAIPTSQ